MLFAGLLLGGFGAAIASADGAKPIAVITFSGYDELMTDIECIGKLSDQPDLVKMIEGPLTMMTQGKGLAGLDKSRPWGVVVLAGDTPMPTGYGFIPVTKLEDLLAVLKDLGMEASDAGDGATKISGPKGQTIFVKQKGDWAYICMSEDGFADVAADPAKLLGDLPKKYNLSVRLLIQNIPSSLRETATGFMRMGMQAGMEKMPDESDEDHALRMKMAQNSIEQTRKMLEEIDSIFLGFAIDEKAESAHLDVELTAIAGTDWAKQLSAIKKGKTAFGGFYQSDAALTICQFATLDKTQQEQLNNSLAMYRAMLNRAITGQDLGDDEKAKAKQMVDDIVKVFEDTIATGKMDFGAAVSLEPAKSTIIAGGSIADGAAVDKIVRDLAAIAKAEQPEAAKMLKLDAAEYAGIKFHSLTIALSEEMESREQLVGIIGEEVKLVLGVGGKQIYLGVGDGALDKLKAAIDQSKSEAGKEVSPVRMSLSVTSIAKLVGELAEDFTAKMVASSISAALESAGDDDHITVVGDAIPNGVRYRLTFQKGILKVLGMAPRMAGGR
jgi:hypothetical protein